MKYFWVLLCLICLAFTSEPDNSPIRWNQESRLSINDFRGLPDDASKAVAITASGVSYQLAAEINNNEVHVDCNIGAYFYPNESWYKVHLADGKTLGHEQLHFDISELMAREFRRRVKEKKFSANVKREVKVIYKEVTDSLNKLQNLYDKETNFSINDEQQELWRHKIAKALEETKAFKD